MQAKGGRILLVEDHADTARAFSMLLMQDGFQVTLAETLEEALKTCAQGSFDLLICDVRLKDGNGIDVLQATRKHCPEIRGIVVTGYDEPEPRESARWAGFQEYLVKPLTYVDLHAAVMRAMSPPGAAESTVMVT
jgi:two-component system response regulator AtoC